MSENETKLINLIRDHNNPEKALSTSIEIILSFLNHPESSAPESVVATLE